MRGGCDDDHRRIAEGEVSDPMQQYEATQAWEAAASLCCHLGYSLLRLLLVRLICETGHARSPFGVVSNGAGEGDHAPARRQRGPLGGVGGGERIGREPDPVGEHRAVGGGWRHAAMVGPPRGQVGDPLP